MVSCASERSLLGGSRTFLHWRWNLGRPDLEYVLVACRWLSSRGNPGLDPLLLWIYVHWEMLQSLLDVVSNFE
jgi:hypothetical protein